MTIHNDSNNVKQRSESKDVDVTTSRVAMVCNIYDQIQRVYLHITLWNRICGKWTGINEHRG